MIRYVYVAGPLSIGATGHNVRAAVLAAQALEEHGFVPYIPHLSVFEDAISPKDYEHWMARDFAWLERCDALLRLPGASAGADREVERMLELEKLVYVTNQEPFDARDFARWAWARES